MPNKKPGKKAGKRPSKRAGKRPSKRAGKRPSKRAGERSKKTFVLSLGGSMIVPKEINVRFLKKFRALILARVRAGDRFIIICGGGGLNRMYNRSLKQIIKPAKPSHTDLDRLGIEATYLNAYFVKLLFGSHAYEEVVRNPKRKIKTKKPIIIGCGWKPGCSTDKDAVLSAKTHSAKTVINLTDVAYVYTKDPKKHKDAKRIKKMPWAEYRKIVGGEWTPRLSSPFDPTAAKLAQKMRLKSVIAKGSDLKNLRKVISGKKFRGTVIG